MQSTTDAQTHRSTDYSVGTESGTLVDIYAVLRTKRFVDLTHAFAPDIPHWQGFPNERRQMLLTYTQAGVQAQRYSFVGQWGTHVDAPAHVVAGLRTGRSDRRARDALAAGRPGHPCTGRGRP